MEIIKSNKLCNICGDICENETTLKCNTEHVFCYVCIYDWFKHLMTANCTYSQYKKRMCPICKKDGGYLEYYPIYVYNNNIHIKKETLCNTPSAKNPSKLCSKKGLYNGKCYIHNKNNSMVCEESANIYLDNSNTYVMANSFISNACIAIDSACIANACIANACIANAYIANASIANACIANLNTNYLDNPNTYISNNAYSANAYSANAYTANAYSANAYSANAYIDNIYTANLNTLNFKNSGNTYLGNTGNTYQSNLNTNYLGNTGNTSLANLNTNYLGNIYLGNTCITSINTFPANINTTYASNNELNDIIINIKNDISKLIKYIENDTQYISLVPLIDNLYISPLNTQTVSMNPTKFNNDISPLKCGVKLKSKDGYCNNKPHTKFNGKCGLHKNM